MEGMMDGMGGGMMWGMGVFWLLILILLLLAIGALIKYLFFGGTRKTDTGSRKDDTKNR